MSGFIGPRLFVWRKPRNIAELKRKIINWSRLITIEILQEAFERYLLDTKINLVPF